MILFDMDGTLTPARKPAEDFLKPHIKRLLEVANIGIVTGSDMDYLLQQCESLWTGDDGCDPSKITLMPCNGTKVYKWKDSCKSKFNNWNLIESNDMRKFMGDESFDNLMKLLISAQYAYISKNPEHPLTGHFFCYRDSMINWCPVGRNARDEERKKFIEFDIKSKSRIRLMTGVQTLSEKTLNSEIVFALGGNTSIDIYPKGWDKTFALNHLKDYVCWFVGDRCEPTGNDYTIYEHLKKDFRAFKTTGPEETAEIIEKIISIIKIK